MQQRKDPRFDILVGFLGNTALVGSFPRIAPAQDEARRLRLAYPDRRAEFWVSASRFRMTARWDSIRARLSTKNDGPATPIFDDVVRTARQVARSKKRNADPKARTQGMIVGAIHAALEGRRKDPALPGLPYTVTELMDHLAAQFQWGMGWHNWGAWHIDHIKPGALFDMTDPRQVQECWALSNLQPLWARENILKRDRYQPPSAV